MCFGSKNIHFESLRSEINPVVMFIPTTDNKRFMSIRVKTEDLVSTIGFIENEWTNVSPQFPIRYRFLDDRFEELYETEAQRSKLFTSFSFLAIFLACLGLLGLSSFTVSQRTKEISVRKVLGASLNSIVMVLSKEFLILIFVRGEHSFLVLLLHILFLGEFLELEQILLILDRLF